MSGATPATANISTPKRGKRVRTVCEIASDVKACVNGSNGGPFRHPCFHTVRAELFGGYKGKRVRHDAKHQWKRPNRLAVHLGIGGLAADGFAQHFGCL